jgi:hypothetical protein
MVRLTIPPSVALAILFDRLKWPVPLVRWQTAKRIRDSLDDAATRDATTTALLEQLAACRFETEVCSLLTIIFLTKQTARPARTLVTSRIKRPSLLSDILLDLTYGKGSGTGAWRYRSSGTMPHDFEAEGYFDRFRTAHAPPILSNNLRRLASQSGQPFLQRWSFEWTKLCEDLQVPRTNYPHYFDDVLESRAGITGQYWQRMHEAYLSSYLRTLAYAVEEWGMPRDIAGGYVVELADGIAGLFELEPSTRPAWLSDFPERFCAEDADFDQVTRELVHASRTEGRVVVSLDVPIASDVKKHAKLVVTTHLCSADYELAADAQLFNRLMLHDVAGTFSLQGPTSLSSLTNAIEAGAKGDQAGVCVSVMPIPFGCWQSDYHNVGIPIPASYVAPGLSISASALGLDMLDPQGGVRARTTTWNDHWSPPHPKMGTTRCAMLTTLDEQLLNKASVGTGRSIGFFVNLRSWKREKDYGDYAQIEQADWCVAKDAFLPAVESPAHQRERLR